MLGRVSPQDARLERGLSPLDATAVVVGNTIGAGIFMVPQVMASAVADPAGVFLAWGAGAALTLCGALTFAELGAALPRAGGVYAFLAETLHPMLGFLFGWSLLWVINSGAIASMAVTMARYAGTLAPLDERAQTILAVAVILALSGLNLLGVRRAGFLQTLVTAAKLVAISGIVVVVFLAPGAGPATVSAHGFGISNFGLAVAAALFAFGGWHTVTFNAEEIARPQRSIPVALIAGTLVLVATYMAVNAAYLHVLPIEQVASSSRVAADVVALVLGEAGAVTIAVLVMVSTFGAANGLLLSGPRVYYAMARDGGLMRPLAGVDARFHTPHVAIVAQGVWAAVLAASGTYETLLTRVIFTEWGFFALAAVGLLRWRRLRPEVPRPYRVWGYPVVPLVFAAASAAVVVNTFVRRPGTALFGLAVLATGLPVYWFGRRRAVPGGSGARASG
jgi:APA family basic amino acid/polyamine antiporter